MNKRRVGKLGRLSAIKTRLTSILYPSALRDSTPHLAGTMTYFWRIECYLTCYDHSPRLYNIRKDKVSLVDKDNEAS